MALRALCILIIIFSTSTVPTIAAPAEPAAPQIELVVVREQKSECLDPHASYSGGDIEVCSLIYEGLVRPSLEVPVSWQPCLAENWKVNADATEYTFKIRKGVKFHDGDTCDAAAVKRSFDRMRDPRGPSAPAVMPYAEEFWSHIESVVASDSVTLAVKLSRSDPRFLSTCGMPTAAIVSPKALDSMAKLDAKRRSDWLTRHSSGTGPFAASTQLEDGKIVLTAFDAYWQGKPRVSKITVKTTRDAKARAEELRNGSADIIDRVPPDFWGDLEKLTSVHLHAQAGQNLGYLAMNCDAKCKFITAELHVREAISLAIDRDPLCALNAPAAIAQFVLLPECVAGHPKGYKPQLDEVKRDDALKRAKKLIADAGAVGAEVSLVFPKLPRPYLPKPNATADILRGQLEAIGLKVVLEPRAMVEIAEGIAKGNYALLLLGWMGETGDAEDFWKPLLGGKNGPGDNNTARFWDKDVQAEIDAACGELDKTKRAEKF
ncbi:partial Heme-binding protein A, partial [Anaerolineae bacterium]